MLSRLGMVVVACGALAVLPEVSGAQAAPPVRSLVPGKRDRAQDDVPDSYRPPPGMCRVWIDGVPASQQPAPTDCPTAIRNRAANARVIFSDDSPRRRDEGERGEKRDRDDESRDESRDEKRKGKRKKP